MITFREVPNAVPKDLISVQCNGYLLGHIGNMGPGTPIMFKALDSDSPLELADLKAIVAKLEEVINKDKDHA